MITKPAYGSEMVTRLPAITLTLEDGSSHTFRWAVEVGIPDDTLRQTRDYLRGPAQFAFWAYQTERALREVREKEKELASKEGEMNLVYRRWYVERTEEYTEGQIRSRVDTDATVADYRDRLNSARAMYGTLRALRDAVESRVHVLRQLVQSHHHGQSIGTGASHH